MRLVDCRHHVPERKVSKDETMDLFRHYSRMFYPNESALNEVVGVADKLLTFAKFNQSCSRGPNERFYQDFIEMTRSMIADSGIKASDIGSVAYCGICKGYLEPATACQMAAHLGLKGVEFFDITDACNGWSRTARLIDGLLRRGPAKPVLVLSLELIRSRYLNSDPVKQLGAPFHPNYSIRTPAELEWRIWSATTSEAGIASLFVKDDSNDWYFDYDCDCTEHLDCAMGMPNHPDYDLAPMLIDGVAPDRGAGFFYAYAKRIGQSIRTHLPPLLKKAQHLLDEAKVVVPHSLSGAVYEPLFKAAGVHEKAVYPFSEYGNVTSCGVPAGIAMALRSGKLNRGDRVVLVPTGSGSSAGVVSFVF